MKVLVAQRANPARPVQPHCQVPRGRQKNVAASAPREGSFALISCSLDEARDMHEQYEPRDCVSCMRLSRLVSGRRVPQCVPTSCMCLTYVNMHSPKPPHSLHTSPHARYAPLPHLHVNPPTPPSAPTWGLLRLQHCAHIAEPLGMGMVFGILPSRLPKRFLLHLTPSFCGWLT